MTKKGKTLIAAAALAALALEDLLAVVAAATVSPP